MAGPSCNPNCSLYSKGSGFALTDGTGSSGVLLLGEALGEAEARMSKPFCGDAGLMLGQVLHRLGYKREAFLIANRTNCRPPQNWMEGAPWEADAVEACRPYFEETLRRNPQIRVLVPMGNSAMHYLLGQKGIANFHGYVQWHPGYEKWVVPTFHPSYLMRGNWSEIQTARFDLQRAVELARNPQYVIKPVHYLEHPSHTQALEFLGQYREALQGNPSLVLAADIETPMSAKLDEDDAEESESYQIERISFSFRECEAITMPWEGSYVEVARELLAMDGEVTFFNGDRFDIPRLQAAGCSVTRTIDTQELFHFVYPDLPKKLGYVAPFFIEDCEPWKHLNTANPTFYSCRDSDYLLRIHNKLVAKVKADGRWESFEREIMECNRRTAQMSRNGIAIDEPVRLEMVKQEEVLAEEIHLSVQDLVPRELKPIHPKGGYKQPSPEGRCQGGHKLKETCSICQDTQGWSAQHVLKEGLRQIEVEEMAVVEGRQQVAKFLRWARVEEFNIGSGQQLIRYIEFKLGKSAVPKAKKTGKPTVERDQLERLAKKSGDPVLLLACRASEIQARVSHLNGWAPGPDGLVHAVFTNQPATFRLAAKNPNVFNFPTRSEAMHAMRRMVIPGVGYEWIVSRDYSGIEAIQVGIYAGDTEYERLAKFGIHTFMAAKKANLQVETSWPDEQLQAALKEYKKVTQTMRLNGAGSSNLYDAMKRGNHMPWHPSAEVLTPKGWVRMDAYEEGTPIAEWENGDVHFRVPKDLVWSEATELVEFKSHYFNSLTTPAHGFPVYPKWKPKSYRNVAAKDLNSNYKGITSGHYAFGDININVRLAAAIQADGTLNGNTSTFHLVKPRKVARMREILEGEHYSTRPCGCHEGGAIFHIKPESIIPLRWILSASKEFTDGVLNLTKDCAEALFAEIFKWDGTITTNGTHTYYNKSKVSVEWMQTIAHLLGKRVYVNRQEMGTGYKSICAYADGDQYYYRLYLSKRKDVLIPKSKKVVPYNGQVVCFTTQSGYFLVRYAGSIQVSCNTNYGATANMLQASYPDVFPNRKSAQLTQDFIFDLFPKIKRWQDDVVERAHREAVLVNAFGYPRWFWFVKKPVKKAAGWSWERAEDAKSAIATLPQSSAAVILRRALTSAPAKELLASGKLFLSPHDELISRARDEEDAEWVSEQMRLAMEAPIAEQGGRVFKTAAKRGRNWAEVE